MRTGRILIGILAPGDDVGGLFEDLAGLALIAAQDLGDALDACHLGRARIGVALKTLSTMFWWPSSASSQVE